MQAWLLFCAGLALSSAALAAGTQGAPVRASMLVTGTITESPDGGVVSYAIDHPEELPPAVKGLLTSAIPTWKFDAATVGAGTAAKTPMAVRVVATTLAADKIQLQIEGVHFGAPDGHPGIAVVKKAHPMYPPAAARALVRGTVYVAMRVDAAGKVTDIVVQQVDMGFIGRDAELPHWREVLGRATRESLSHMVFSAAADASKPERTVRTSVTFVLGNLATGDSTRSAYGQWNVYQPGPVQPIPWLAQQPSSGGVDALPDGDIDLVGQGLRLRTPQSQD